VTVNHYPVYHTRFPLGIQYAYRMFTLLVGFAKISGLSPRPVGGQLPPLHQRWH